MRILGRTRQKLGRLMLQAHDGLEELKFLRSFRDLKIMYQNVAYLVPRIVGIDRSTTAPPSLQIEPTNYCNARCICCSTAGSSRVRGYMDFDLFRSIIDDAAKVGVQRIHLYLHGEPLLHPRIVEMIGYIKLSNLAVHLTTNGMLLDGQRAEAILRSGVNSADHMVVSILGGSREVHEGIMKKVNHDVVIANTSGFTEARTRLGVNGPVIETMFYTMPENEHEEEQYFEYWRGKVDHARLGGRISHSFARQEGITIAPRKQTCKNLWERMTVFWNGDVTLCCEDVDGDWLLGNLRDSSIREVWNCERLLSIKEIHRKRRFQDLPFCNKCDM